MNKFRLASLLVAIAGCLSGCQSIPANRPAVTSVMPSVMPPTSLIITVEGTGMTEAEYKARRDDLVSYLIERGYIQAESDLITDAGAAERIIRATLGADGGFKFSVYNLDSEVVTDQTAVADNSIPPNYYGDYYYYGFEPVPFYGYSSWPAYYPIYPTYPVCAPPKPSVPYCWPAGQYWHDHRHVEPALYVNCGFQSKPSNQWAWHQSYPAWTTENHYSHVNSKGGQHHGQPLAAAEHTSRPNPSTPDARTAGRGAHARHPASPVDPVADATATPTTASSQSSSPNQRPVGRDPRSHSPKTPTSGSAPAPQLATTTPDNRPHTVYPRSSTPDNRPASARPAPADARPRSSSPDHSNAPRPANVANNVRPAPAPSPHTDSAPRSSPAPHYNAPAQSHSSAPAPTYQAASNSGKGDSSSSRQPNER